MISRAIQLAAVSLAVFLCGCKMTYSHAPGTGAPLDGLKTGATYDIIGPAQGSSGGTSILFGLFTTGFEDKSGDWGRETHGILGGGGKARALNAAQFNAIESLPEADALLAPRWTIEEEDFIIFSRVKATVKGKGIRYNSSAK